MGLVFTESFDGPVPLGKWPDYTSAGISTISPGPGLHGNALTVSSTSVVLSRKFVGNDAGDQHATFTLGWRGFPNHSTGDITRYEIAYMATDAGTQPHLALQRSGGTLQLWRHGQLSGGTHVDQLLASGPFPANPQYLEWTSTLCPVGGSTGTSTARIDGVQILTFTGDTNGVATNFTTATAWDSFGLAVGSNVNTSLDDIYLCNGAGTVNNSFLGDATIYAIVPNGNGNLSMFVNDLGNSTNNYSRINNAGFVDAFTTGDEDLYRMPITGFALAGVTFWALAKRLDTASKLSVLDVQDGVEVGSAGQVLSTTIAPYKLARDLDVHGAAWTVTAFNGTQIGVKAV